MLLSNKTLATLTGFEPVISAVTGQRIRPAMLKCHNILAGILGFEPRLTESKSAVLPLHYIPTNHIETHSWSVVKHSITLGVIMCLNVFLYGGATGI